MIVDKYTVDGQKSGQIELSDKVFGDEINNTIVYEFIKAADSNLRQGTHKTKERSEISGGGIKPWKQKGTGRARQGTIRAPQFRGGGTVFGPRVRTYRIDLPRKIRQQAYRIILSIKARNNQILVIQDFDVTSGKTKDIAKILDKFSVSRGMLLFRSVAGSDMMVKRAIRNIPSVCYNNAERFNARDAFNSAKILITESAVNYFNERLA